MTNRADTIAHAACGSPADVVDVAVIGAGPVGLATALQLGRAGIPTLVIERDAKSSQCRLPVGIHPPTMEIFRRWGVADRIRDVALPRERSCGVAWMTRLNRLELGRVVLPDDSEPMRGLTSNSPELPCVAGEDLIQHILAETLAASPSVDVWMDTTVTGVVDEGRNALLQVTDPDRDTVRARYVVAADGGASPTRQLLGMAETSVYSYGVTLAIHFRADLDPVIAGRPYQLWWIVNRDVRGVFAPVTNDGRWVFKIVGLPEEGRHRYDTNTCIGLVRAGVGIPDLDVDVLRVHWSHNDHALIERWRVGRVLFAGDAAHRFPPHVGLGINSGIQDSVSLAGKLIDVLRSDADESWLDTYQSERRPIAARNVRQLAGTLDPFDNMQWLVTDPAIFETIEDPAGRYARRELSNIASKLAFPMLRSQQFGQYGPGGPDQR
jgi:2-polyprenyl-6-methoxyphenol hydroxylase-like FAD-dependent oxidoreductase